MGWSRIVRVSPYVEIRIFFAEFERSLIRERPREGIALAKQRGAYRGRKKSLFDMEITEAWRCNVKAQCASLR